MTGDPTYNWCISDVAPLSRFTYVLPFACLAARNEKYQSLKIWYILVPSHKMSNSCNNCSVIKKLMKFVNYI